MAAKNEAEASRPKPEPIIATLKSWSLISFLLARHISILAMLTINPSVGKIAIITLSTPTTLTAVVKSLGILSPYYLANISSAINFNIRDINS